MPNKVPEAVKHDETNGDWIVWIDPDLFVLQVNVCYFCQSGDLKESASLLEPPLSGYQDGLFWLNPEEKPLCDADALLLFCIDISGSMSITSMVPGTHTDALVSRGLVLASSIQTAVSLLFPGVRGGVFYPHISSPGNFCMLQMCAENNSSSFYTWNITAMTDAIKEWLVIKVTVFKPVCPGSCAAVCPETKWAAASHTSGPHHVQPSGTSHDCRDAHPPGLFFITLLTLLSSSSPGDHAWIWQFHITASEWRWAYWKQLPERGCSRFCPPTTTFPDQGPLTETSFGVRRKHITVCSTILTNVNVLWLLFLLEVYLRMEPQLSVQLLSLLSLWLPDSQAQRYSKQHKYANAFYSYHLYFSSS